MTDWAFLIGGIALGAVVGGLLGWLIAAGRAARAAAGQVSDLHARTGAAESAAAELRRVSEERERETAVLRESLDRERQGRIEAQTRDEATRRNFEAQKQSLDEVRKQLRDVFASVAADQLSKNNEVFSRQADQKIQPLREALDRFEKQIRLMEQSRQTAYGGVSNQLEAMQQTHERLQKETAGLVAALRQPNVRGRWGEITLRRVVEVAGMCEHCDFREQSTTHGEGGRLRPDLVVTLPNDRTIVVDAKAPLEAYLKAVESQSEQERQAGMLAHARTIRAHMQALSNKGYWSQFADAPDFVVMFLPGESFFSAALEQDRTLIEDGVAGRVILATPTTLIALLRTVAHSWQQQQVAENSQRIADAGRELFDRVCIFADHLSRVGDGLRRATGAFNDAVGSWQLRVLPSGERLTELGVRSRKGEMPALPPLDATPRAVPSLGEREVGLFGEPVEDEEAVASHAGGESSEHLP